MKEEKSIESRIQQAMRSRVQHFRDQADSLTFEGVRRLLEKNLVLDTYVLDVHKRYVKQLLEKYLSEIEDENVSKGSEQIKLGQVKEEEDKPKEHKVTDIHPEDEGKVEDSPVMGLLSGNESAKSGTSETQANTKDNIPTVDMIKEALWKKETYFKSKSEELTVAGVRRLLEDDLELKKYSLDSFKKLISKQLDEVLNSQNDTPDADSSHSESVDLEVEVKPKKKLAPKGKVQISEKPKKRKRPAKEPERARKKQTKPAEETSDEKNNVQDVDDESNAEKSESSAEKSVKVGISVFFSLTESLEILDVVTSTGLLTSVGMTTGPSVCSGSLPQSSEFKKLKDFCTSEFEKIQKDILELTERNKKEMEDRVVLEMKNMDNKLGDLQKSFVTSDSLTDFQEVIQKSFSEVVSSIGSLKTSIPSSSANQNFSDLATKDDMKQIMDKLISIEKKQEALDNRLKALECKPQSEILKRKHDDQDPDDHVGEKRRRIYETERIELRVVSSEADIPVIEKTTEGVVKESEVISEAIMVTESEVLAISKAEVMISSEVVTLESSEEAVPETSEIQIPKDEEYETEKLSYESEMDIDSDGTEKLQDSSEEMLNEYLAMEEEIGEPGDLSDVIVFEEEDVENEV